MNNSALILIDLQNDFCEGGNLAVPHASEVIAIANQLQQKFQCVIATQDWHPKNHLSFASNHSGKNIGEIIDLKGVQQILWPDHCIQNTKGADFHPALNTQNIEKIFYKGTNPEVDSYSGFFDNNHLHSTGLSEYLRAKNITDLYIMGLATDYCVKYSCLDAVNLNFNVYLIQDGCRGVELQPGDIKKALKEMEDAGVNI